MLVYLVFCEDGKGNIEINFNIDEAGDYKLEISKDDVKRFIKYHRNNEWTLLKDILDNVESVLSHYSSPKSSLYSALTTIEFKDIESKVINGKVHFRVKE